MKNANPNAGHAGVVPSIISGNLDFPTLSYSFLQNHGFWEMSESVGEF
jgi:hypothetical protein